MAISSPRRSTLCSTSRQSTVRSDEYSSGVKDRRPQPALPKPRRSPRLRRQWLSLLLAARPYVRRADSQPSDRMNIRRESRTEDPSQPFPSPDGHRAYGVNGYLFSSPLDLMFDEQTVNRQIG